MFSALCADAKFITEVFTYFAAKKNNYNYNFQSDK